VKKILLAAVAVIVLAYPLYPWLLGHSLEKRIDAQVDTLLELTPYLGVTERKYRRGWFRSEQWLTFELFGDFLPAIRGKSANADAPSAGHPMPAAAPMVVSDSAAQPEVPAPEPEVAPRPARLVLHNTIHHGPFPRLSNFGLARIDSQLVLSEQTKAQLAKVFGAKEPFSIRTTVGVLGGSVTRLRSPALRDAPFGKQGGKLTWDGFAAEIDVGRRADRLKFEGGVPQLRVVEADSAMTLKGLRFDGDLSRALRTLYSGEAKLSIDELAVASTTGQSFSMRNVLYAADADLKGQYLDVVARIGVGPVDSKQLKLDSVHYDFTIKRLHAETLEQLSAGLRDSFRANINGTSADTAAAEASAIMAKQIGQLLTHDPEFQIDRFSIALPAGEALLTGVIQTKGITAKELTASASMAAVLMTKISADLDLRIAEKFLTELAGLGADQTAEQSQAVAGVAAQVNMLIDQGYARRDGEAIVSKIQFRNGALTVNGKSLFGQGGVASGAAPEVSDMPQSPTPEAYGLPEASEAPVSVQ
jgi:uncharacterized protein YdgA (DUF945 family)